jgi:hypothetical protein
MVTFVFPLPLLPLLPFPLNSSPPFPLLFPFVGMAERPIPVEMRLKPDPPGLYSRSESVARIVYGELGLSTLTAVVGVGASILRDVLNLSQTGSGSGSGYSHR